MKTTNSSLSQAVPTWEVCWEASNPFSHRVSPVWIPSGHCTLPLPSPRLLANYWSLDTICTPTMAEALKTTPNILIHHIEKLKSKKKLTWVGGFCPWREEAPFVRLVPEILIQICVSYFLQGLDIVHGNHVGVQVHEFYPHLKSSTPYALRKGPYTNCINTI